MCDICNSNPCNNRCPNFSKKYTHYCSICDEGIDIGEEYIENDKGEYAHYECFDRLKSLLEFLGYDIKEMKDIE